jgi:hypothetical protein
MLLYMMLIRLFCLQVNKKTIMAQLLNAFIESSVEVIQVLICRNLRPIPKGS